MPTAKKVEVKDDFDAGQKRLETSADEAPTDDADLHTRSSA